MYELVVIMFTVSLLVMGCVALESYAAPKRPKSHDQPRL
jgi:hypothetical protein